jgi:hypothetical protein
MYVSDSQACNLPNSETPMSADAISAQDAYIALVGSSFTNGNATLSAVMQALGGNSIDDLSAGNAGLPTTGAGGFPWFPGPSVPNPFPVSDQGTPVGSGAGGGSTTQTAAACVPPRVIPLVTVIPVPAVKTPAAVTVPKPAASLPQPAAVSSGRKRIPQSSCRTGNICLDIRNGCVLASQVDPAQLLACSQAGYAGNLNLYSQFIIDGTDAPLGTPMPNPPPFDPSMNSNRPGLSGLGTAPSGGAWLGAGLGLAALFWLGTAMQKRGSR